jgi:hypothetical protein
MLIAEKGGAYIVRIDKGEEITSCIKLMCERTGMKTGLISGLGSVSFAKLGLFDVEKKEYIEKSFEGIFEIASMNGNISSMDGKPYLHLHAVLGDREFKTYGGHLAEAIVAATCEIIAVPLKEGTGRYFDREIGLNLLGI